jgi:hypothetical protein
MNFLPQQLINYRFFNPRLLRNLSNSVSSFLSFNLCFLNFLTFKPHLFDFIIVVLSLFHIIFNYLWNPLHRNDPHYRSLWHIHRVCLLFLSQISNYRPGSKFFRFQFFCFSSLTQYSNIDQCLDFLHTRCNFWFFQLGMENFGHLWPSVTCFRRSAIWHWEVLNWSKCP